MSLVYTTLMMFSLIDQRMVLLTKRDERTEEKSKSMNNLSCPRVNDRRVYFDGPVEVADGLSLRSETTSFSTFFVNSSIILCRTIVKRTTHERISVTSFYGITSNEIETHGCQQSNELARFNPQSSVRLRPVRGVD